MILYGNKTRYCTSSAEWSGTPPVCSEISCPYLSRPPNCDLDLTSSSYNSIAEYKCHNGYKFTSFQNNEFKRRCTENGNWDKFEPTCERTFFLPNKLVALKSLKKLFLSKK